MYLFICFPQCCITCPILWPAHPSLLQAGSGLYVRAPGHATHTHTCCQPLMNTFFTTMLLHYAQPHVLSFSFCPITVSCCPTTVEKKKLRMRCTWMHTCAYTYCTKQRYPARVPNGIKFFFLSWIERMYLASKFLTIFRCIIYHINMSNSFLFTLHFFSHLVLGEFILFPLSGPALWNIHSFTIVFFNYALLWSYLFSYLY